MRVDDDSGRCGLGVEVRQETHTVSRKWPSAIVLRTSHSESAPAVILSTLPLSF